jgi:cytochrome P450
VPRPAPGPAQETSAILLGWAAALLAHHPAAQAAAADEAAAALGGAPPGAGDLGKLPRVTAVVLEALRLYSPAYMVGRCASADVALAGGYRLPRGTTVLVRCGAGGAGPAACLTCSCSGCQPAKAPPCALPRAPE